MKKVFCENCKHFIGTEYDHECSWKKIEYGHKETWYSPKVEYIKSFCWASNKNNNCEEFEDVRVCKIEKLKKFIIILICIDIFLSGIVIGCVVGIY